MSDHDQLPCNEEYDQPVPPEVPRNVPDSYFNVSDSEDDSSKGAINYFDLSSSSSESADEDEDYFQKFMRPSSESEFLDCNRNDDEDDLIIPLETDDCDFVNVDLDSYGQMCCPICSIVFKSKIRFVIHKRRHFALDHFMCPVCQKGFTKLEQCQAHEYKEHKETQDNDANSSFPKYYFRSRNARKSINPNEALDVDEQELICIVPSTCLYPYDGPDINEVYQAYQVEVKYGRNEKKSHSKIQSKYALECRKRSKNILAMLEARLDRRKVKQESQSNRPSKVSDSEDFPCGPRRAVARLAPAPRRNSLRFREMGTGPKCYFCSLCGFTSTDKEGIEDHQYEAHPEVPVSDLLQFLYIDKSLRRKKNENASGNGEERKGRSGLREKQTPGQLARAKQLRKKDKRKEAKLFRNRRHIPRIWETASGPPAFEEFAFAIGLIKKTDVLLGPRGQHRSVTSNLLRRQQREVSPCPLVSKSLRIHVQKMPPSKTSRFYCCQHCNFFAVSTREVLKHRRAEHLQSLRQKVNQNEDSSEVPEPEDPNRGRLRKRNRRVANDVNSVASSESNAHLDDISSLSVKVRSRQLDSIGTMAQPPRKKTKVS